MIIDFKLETKKDFNALKNLELARADFFTVLKRKEFYRFIFGLTDKLLF